MTDYVEGAIRKSKKEFERRQKIRGKFKPPTDDGNNWKLARYIEELR